MREAESGRDQKTAAKADVRRVLIGNGSGALSPHTRGEGGTSEADITKALPRSTRTPENPAEL